MTSTWKIDEMGRIRLAKSQVETRGVMSRDYDYRAINQRDGVTQEDGSHGVYDYDE
jgi:hypothetical protein